MIRITSNWKIHLALMVFIAILPFIQIHAADYYVNAATGDNIAANGTLANPWKTITYALSHISGSGHTLHVASGTYNTALGEVFPINVKDGISLLGSGVDVCTINADKTSSVISCISILDSLTRVEGFTITGGELTYPSNTAGIGIYISSGSLVKIVNNKITGNHIIHHPWSNQRGVGIYIENSSPIIKNNVVTNNTGDFTEGQGIYVYNSSPLIQGNTISKNVGWTGAYVDGSGLAIVGAASSPRVINNTISENGDHGIRCSESCQPKIANNLIISSINDGIQAIYSNPKIINNTITKNGGHGIYVSSSSLDSLINNIISLNSGYGIYEENASSDPGKVWYNLFYTNSSGLYFDEGTTGYIEVNSLNSSVAECKHNLYGDPMFENQPLGDYRLQSGSPAVDAGDPDSPLDSDCTRADIGAIATFNSSYTLIASVSISVPNTTVCQNDNVTFTATPTNGGTYPGYQWKINSSNVGTNNPTYSTTSLVDGDIITCVMTSSISCTTGNPATSNSITMTVNPLPLAAGTITGTASLCQGTDNVSFSIPDITNATSYVWSYSGSGIVINNSTTNSVTINFSNSSTSGNLAVKGHNSCGDGTISSNYPVTVNPLVGNAGTITGNATVCQGQNNISYSVPVIDNAATYIWTLPGGASGSSSTNSISVNYSSSAVSGNITVKGNNGCGDGTISNYPVTVNPLPVAAGTITGTAIVCQGTANILYSVPAIDYATTYIWTLPTGVTGSSTTNSINVNFGITAISGNITVKGNNGCGNGDLSNFAVTVNPLPDAAGTITGASLVCAGATNILYSVPIITNATSYLWTIPGGATGSSTTNSINVTFGASPVSENITVKGNNSCGDGSISTYGVTASIPAGAAGTITGSSSVCLGQTNVSYSVPAIANAVSYIWNYTGTGATINGNSNSISIDFSASATAGNLTVKGTNGCGDGTISENYPVEVNPFPSAAGTITGTSAVCQGAANILFSVPAIDNATTYTWTLPTGASGSSSANSISVNFGLTAVSGNITVKGNNSCGDGTISSYAVTVNPLPVAAGTITGTATVCQGQNNVLYSVPAITNASIYVWTLPDGATGSSTTNSINVNFGINAVSGNITVKGNNSCGDGNLSNFAVTVNPLPASAGTITGTGTVCQGAANVLYSVPAIANATTYIWTLPTGATGSSTTNSIAVNFGTSAISGNIVVKGNNACGDGNSSNFAVTVNPLPAAAGAIGGSSTITQGQNNVTYSVSPVANASSYIWSYSGSGATINGTGNSVTIDFSGTATSGILKVKGTNSCGYGPVSANFAISNSLDYYVNGTTGNDIISNGTLDNPWKTITYALSHVSGTGRTINVAAGIYNTVLGETFPLMMVDGVSLVGTGKDSSSLIPSYTESFEAGLISSDYSMGGNAPWAITNANSYDGSFSIKSGTISSSQTSSISIPKSSSIGMISFYIKVSSESCCDRLQFYIDGVSQQSWGGEVAWSKKSFTVAPGFHTFKWEYSKDGSINSGSDCAWIDYITFPESYQNETIISGTSGANVIKCVGILDSNTKIDGFTITAGGGSQGAGLYISAGSSLSILNNSIQNNSNTSISGYGGGIYIINSAPRIINNIISLNSTYYSGGGIYMSNSTPVIMNNTISDNTKSSGSGGGIYVSGSSPLIKGNKLLNNSSCLYITGSTSSPSIINNVISKNPGDGIYCSGASVPTIISNTISDNTGNGIYISAASPDSIFNNIISYNSGYGISESSTSYDPGKVWYNLFYQNGIGIYRDEGTTDYYAASTLNSGVTECKYNISGDPLFTDQVNGNYHLQPGSPAIDAGDPSFPYSLEPKPNGNRINIGSYGNTSEAATSVGVSSISVAGQGGISTITTDKSTLQMIETVLPVNAADKSVNWIISSEDADTAMINTNGLLTARRNGKVTIRATAKDGTGIYGEKEIVITGQFDITVATLATNITKTGFDANWNNNASATGYYLDVATDIAFTTCVTGYNNKDVLNVTSFSVTGLTANTMYYYRVRAYNAGGTSINSNTITATTLADPPDVPVANSASSISQTSLTANWTASATATGYYLDVATDETFSTFAPGYNNKDVLNVTGYSVTGLISNTTYYYRVRAYRTGGTSVNSNTITTTTLPNPPAAPTANTATTIVQTSFTANWTSLPTATGYYLDIATDNGFTTFVAGYNNLDVLNVSSYSVTGLTASTIYYYKVRAYNTGGTSGSSNTIAITTLPDPPAAPTAIAATTILKTSFTANWTASATATGYYLDVATDNSFTTFVTGYNNKNVSSVISYNVTGLTANTTYYFRLRAYNTGGAGASSNSITTTTLPDPPAAPVASTATTIVQTSFTANWTASAMATGYYLDVATNSTFTTFVAGLNNKDVLNVTSYNVTGLTVNTTYYYRVRGYNGGGTGASSNTITTITLPNPPAAPTANTATTIVQTSFTAKWTSLGTATGYYLDVATDNGFTTFVAGYNNKDVLNVTSYSVTGLTASTTYYYKVRAYNTGGTGGSSNTIATTTLPDPPAAPTAIAATTILKTSFTANWTASATATGYYLDVATDNSFTTFVTGYNNKNVSSVISYNVTGLTANTTYYFRLRAYNTGGAGASSNSITTTTLPNPPAAPAASTATTIVQTSFTANWTASATATGYYLDVATNSTFTTFVAGLNNKDVLNVTSYNVTGLTANTTYYYRVRGYNTGGTSTSSSTISTTTLPNPPVAPVANSASIISSTSYSLSWTASATATGYYLDVATDSAFTSFVPAYNNINVANITNYNITGLDALTIYYYRVRAYNTGGVSTNSNKIMLTSQPPAVPVLDKPSDQQTDITSRPVLKWFTSQGALTYHLQVSNYSDFSTTVFDDSTITANSGQTGALQNNRIFFWRVRAGNSAGWSSYSDSRNFQTYPAPPVKSVSIRSSFTSPGSRPLGLAWDGNNLWMIDNLAKLYKMDTAGNVRFSKTIPNLYSDLNDLTWDGTGLWIGTGYSQIKVDSLGNFIDTLNVSYWTGSGTEWDGKYFWIGDYNFSSLHKHNKSGAQLLNFSTGDIFGHPTGITYDGINLWVAGSGESSGNMEDIFRYSATGALVAKYDLSTIGLLNSWGFYCMAWDGQSLWYASENSFTINRLRVPYYAAIPGVPALSAPAGSAINVSQNPVLSWNTSSNAEYYHVQVSTNSTFANIIYENSSLITTSAQLYSLTGGTTYYWRVRATNPIGNSAYSAYRSFTTTVFDIPPAPAADAATTITQTGFTSNWTASATATGYYLDVATDNTFTAFITGYNNKDVLNVTGFSVTGLSANTTYYYRVRAYNAVGTSTSSNTITATTLPNAPGTPTANAATAIVQTGFTCNWVSLPTATGYYLDIATDNGFTTFVPGYDNKNVSNVTNYIVTGLTSNTTYYYKVRAYNTGGTSGSSNTITVTTLVSTLVAPTANVATAVTQTSFTANWTASAAATGYYLDVSTGNTFTSFVTGYNSKDVLNVTNYSVTGLVANTTYYYRVQAYDAGGTSNNSNSITSTTLQDLPAAPVATSATAILQTGFTSNWTASASATGYYLDVATDNTFTGFVTGFNNRDVFNITNFPVTGLTSGTTYYYRVRAYNTGGTSTSSNTITVQTPQDPPAAPTATSATVIQKDRFTGNWTASATATSYKLDVATDINFNSKLSAYNNLDVGNVTNYVVTGLNSRTMYYYRVRASNSVGVSSNSSSISVKTLPDAPAAPGNLTAASCNNKVTLNWSAISDADFLCYRIYRGTTSNPVTKVDSIMTGSSTTSIIMNVPDISQVYYFRVTAVLSPGVEGAYSNNVNIKARTGLIPKIKTKWSGALLICNNPKDSIATYQWFKGTTSVAAADPARRYYITNKQAGIYKVETVDINGCKNSSDPVTITATKSLSVYPNPAKTIFAISLNDEPQGKIVISISNTSGTKVMELEAEKGNYNFYKEIPVSELSEGVYYVTVTIDRINEYYSKIVIVK